MRNFLLAASALMLVNCTTPEMQTSSANMGPQQASEVSVSRYEPPPPPQLSPPPRRGWAANYRSTPR
jgi:hypothetical protein